MSDSDVEYPGVIEEIEAEISPDKDAKQIEAIWDDDKIEKASINFTNFIAYYPCSNANCRIFH